MKLQLHMKKINNRTYFGGELLIHMSVGMFLVFDGRTLKSEFYCMFRGKFMTNKGRTWTGLSFEPRDAANCKHNFHHNIEHGQLLRSKLGERTISQLRRWKQLTF